MTWIKRDNILAYFDKGGLEIGSLKAFNLSFLQKWRWSFVHNPDSLWVRLIITIHDDKVGFDLKGCNSKGIWSSTISSYSNFHARDIIPTYTLCRKVGDGDDSFSVQATRSHIAIACFHHYVLVLDGLSFYVVSMESNDHVFFECDTWFENWRASKDSKDLCLNSPSIHPFGGESTVRIIPDSAGILQAAKDAGEDDHFTRGSWLSMVRYLAVEGGTTIGCFGDMKTFCKNEKPENVVAVIKSCTPNALGELTISFKDPPDNYVLWSSRLLHYAKSKPDRKLIYNSIINGPYVRRMIPEPCDPDYEVPVGETFHEQTDDELTNKEVKKIEADDHLDYTYGSS
nr:hypothetical protein [Tanacetum cinerariifolium]